MCTMCKYDIVVVDGWLLMAGRGVEGRLKEALSKLTCVS